MFPIPLVLADLAPWQRTLLTWLGYDFSSTAEGAKPELVWTNLPASWGVFVLIAVIAAVIWAVYSVYRREIDTCPAWVKLILATLRTAVVLLLVVIFLGPALVELRQRTIQPTLVVLRDASQSMNTKDDYEDEAAAKIAAAALHRSLEKIKQDHPSRVQIVNEVLAYGDAKLLADLRSKGKLQALNFAEQVTKVDLRDAKKATRAATESKEPMEKSAGESQSPALPPLVAEGRGSDLWIAIRQSLASDSPAAIVLFSDGQHTGKDDARAAAREAKERGVPLLVVGVGDPSRPRNLKIASVYVRPQVWQDEPFEIDAMVNTQGFITRIVRVELVARAHKHSE